MSDFHLISCSQCGVVINTQDIPDSKKTEYEDGSFGYHCPICKVVVIHSAYDYIGDISK